MNDRSVFLAALELPTAERAAYLDEACAGDDALRRQVERLLRAHVPDDSFLEKPAVAPRDTVDHEPPAEQRSSTIGPYKLLQQIGEGGMGVVYMAEQTEPVRRRVALKVIKPGMDTRQVVARFEAERQALALMDHPNIARVLDAGETPPAYAGGSPLPYFVMELVKGVPITKYCDEHHLTPQQRLELFIPVCQAVQHAHQKGIIHRDLKPSNVLIAQYDGKPVPKVIDFGVAKAIGGGLTEKTLFTDFGAVVGTLEYMSPEQAEVNQLDIDTRSDVYALGVLLYELLTGSTPLERKRLRAVAMLEVLRLIREEEPPRPSTRLSTTEELPAIATSRGLEPKKLSGLVRGDLDWIVMKCLEKDRNRRYETANGLASDVRRYLEDEPVLACPPSAGYRFRKFARRHKAGLWTAAAALLVVLLAAVGIGWTLWDRAAQRTERRLEAAERSADTERAVSVALARADQLAEQAQKMPRGSSAEAAAVLVVWRQADDALGQAVAALSTGVDDDGLRQRVAELRAQLGEGREQTERGHARALRKEKLFRDLDEARMAYSDMGGLDYDYATAAAKYAAAFAAYDLNVTAEDMAELARRIRAAEPEVREALIVALDDWEYTTRKVATAWSATRLHALAEAADTDPWRKRYRAALAADDRAALRALAVEALRSSLPPSSLIHLARSLFARGESDVAVALLRWGRGRHPTDFWMHFSLGRALRNKHKGLTPVEIEEEIGCYRVALALRPSSSVVYLGLGLALYEKKQFHEAIAAFRTAIKLDSNTVLARVSLGLALGCTNQHDEAIAECRAAIHLGPKFVSAHGALGVALVASGRFEEAKRSNQRALELLAEERPALPQNQKLRAHLWRHLEECNELLALEAKLPDVLSGKVTLANPQEWYGLVRVCMFQRRYASAARVNSDAFNTFDDSNFPDNVNGGDRWGAAGYAALAAAGQGIDADKLDDTERSRLRKQALAWARSALDFWRKSLASGKPEERQAARTLLESAQRDSSLASVLDPMALKKLPAEEQEAWRKLWADVRELLKKAGDAK